VTPIMPNQYKLSFNQKHNAFLQTGAIAFKSHSAVVIECGKTKMLITVNLGAKPGVFSFLPLTVNYHTKSYAIGNIPGGFTRREGKSTDKEILISRIIDRSIRPLFPVNFNFDIQVIVTVLSYDQNLVNTDALAINGVVAALKLAGIPLTSTVGAVRVACVDEQYIINPDYATLKKSSFDLLLTSNETNLMMLECDADNVSENMIMEALIYGQDAIQTIMHDIDNFASSASNHHNLIFSYVSVLDNFEIEAIKYAYDKEITSITNITSGLEEYLNAMVNKIFHERQENIVSDRAQELKNEINTLVYDMARQFMRTRILSGELRLDQRGNRDIRPIEIQLNYLVNAHGSAVFTRGRTQALSVVVIGNKQEAQLIEDMDNDYDDGRDNFIFHYNFPAFCVGEVGANFGPKRREIGHGALAKKGLVRLMPKNTDATIRIVSEILSADGSTSMASVCSAALALVNARVGVKKLVAGIAMGLIQEGKLFCSLTDISHSEDFLGDLDLKMIASYDGITAIQMDTKSPTGIDIRLLRTVMSQGSVAIHEILKKMEIATQGPDALSTNIILSRTIDVPKDKIKFIIGRNGENIKKIVSTTGANINISSDTGTAVITAKSDEQIEQAIELIKLNCEPLKTVKYYIGESYEGLVVKKVAGGVLITFGQGGTGLLPTNDPQFAEGSQVFIEIESINAKDKIRLMLKKGV
jgi:polyribonucleotide nucleotidyltransferase